MWIGMWGLCRAPDGGENCIYNWYINDTFFGGEDDNTLAWIAFVCIIVICIAMQWVVQCNCNSMQHSGDISPMSSAALHLSDPGMHCILFHCIAVRCTLQPPRWADGIVGKTDGSNRGGKTRKQNRFVEETTAGFSQTQHLRISSSSTSHCDQWTVPTNV